VKLDVHTKQGNVHTMFTEKDMSKASVQFTEMVREAYAALQAVIEQRWCLVCEDETVQAHEQDGCRCLVCGYVEVQR
jgi:hypothetical protein